MTNVIPFPGHSISPAETIDYPSNRNISCGSHDDPIFREIARHQKAVAAYNAALAADDEGSAPETANAYAEMMMASKCLIIGSTKTRAGLIAQARYLLTLFDMEMDCGGCSTIEDQMGSKQQPGPQMFMRVLALNLRSMGAEFPKAKRRKRSKQ